MSVEEGWEGGEEKLSLGQAKPPNGFRPFSQSRHLFSSHSQPPRMVSNVPDLCDTLSPGLFFILTWVSHFPLSFFFKKKTWGDRRNKDCRLL